MTSHAAAQVLVPVQRSTMPGATRQGKPRALGRAGLDGSQAEPMASLKDLPQAARRVAQRASDITDIGDPGGLVALRAILDGPLC